jgi:hypothetical protein
MPHFYYILKHYNYNNTNYSYNYNYTALQLQLQLQLQLLLHYTRLHHATSSSCGWGDRWNHSKKHNSNHLSIH